jgi:hypothetical protein
MPDDAASGGAHAVIAEVDVAIGAFEDTVPEQSADRRHADAVHDGVAGEGVAQVVEPKVFQPRPLSDCIPDEGANLEVRVLLGFWKYPWRRLVDREPSSNRASGV